ncbi:MAG: hypothetical protein Harvfovirus20_22 [Harvfovirus sp.]|uniref:Uncharacterized protein n=1 Tax=Harvfovirus sp. TaxID=2487768 RepID=A0A3G5A5V2_9VIRU|nr:MAG: hypothetical protein Harvfovirus20_22 [Harvfovirus sp.]
MSELISTIYSVKKYKAIGSKNIVLDPKAKYLVPLKVNVLKKGGVLFNVNVDVNYSTSVGTFGNVLLEIKRNGRTVTDGPQSLIKGDPTFLIGTGEFAWNSVDRDVEPGCYEYILIISNDSESSGRVFGLAFNAVTFARMMN